MSKIRLSNKHGVNPAVPKCFFCQKDKNEIILAGRLPGDAEAPRGAVWDMAPCDECQNYMRQGVICISVKDGETDQKNPYRTGGWAVVRDIAIERLRGVVDNKIIESILKFRFVFLEDAVWDKIGFPRG